MTARGFGGTKWLGVLIGASLAWGQGQGRPATASDRLQFDRVHHMLQDTVVKVGPRLRGRGNERVVLRGTVTRGSAVPNPVLITYEPPERVRVEEVVNGRAVAQGFDGTAHWKEGGNPSREDSDLVESAFLDGVENLLFQAQDAGRYRYLGSTFRAPGSSQRFSVYLVQDEDKLKGRTRNFTRRYLIDVATLLPARVDYPAADGAEISTRFEDWLPVGSDLYPKTVRRFENGVLKMRLDVTSGAASAAVNDSVFRNPGR